jgi:glucose-6-phosphate 1-dehydrogenase
VAVQFKHPPTNLFRNFEPFKSGGCRPGNRIVVNIAPDEGIGLRFEAKIPGREFRIGSVKADFDYNYVFDTEPVEAYGPLIVDAMRGDKTLFKHRDEVEGAWRIVDPVVHLSAEEREVHEYAAGSWGPAAADKLFLRRRAEDVGGGWHNPGDEDVR